MRDTKRTLIKLKKAFLQMLYPNKCAYCSELIDDGDTLCQECYDKYSAECRERCGKCGGSAGECVCVSRIGFKPDVCVTFYRGYTESEGRVTEKLVYILKREYYEALISFFARDVAARLVKSLVRQGRDPKDYVVTYAPRSEASLRKYGFDHGELTAKKIAEYIGAPFVRALVRKGGREQKTLSADERRANTVDSIKLNQCESVDGKKVILFDDLVTTGATMSRCRELLFKAGASDVLTAVIARTARG